MFRRFLEKRRRRRHALRLLDELFADPRRLEKSSLRPDLRPRLDLHHVESGDDGEITAIQFVIVRHPRPYAYSKQRHEVAELYRWTRSDDRIEVAASVNLTRRKGHDADSWG